jgi:aldose 1-epimerase
MTITNSRPLGPPAGKAARIFTLENDRIVARVTDFGGALVSIETPDRAGRSGHVLLGFDDVASYAETRGSFGALLGRSANRIAGGTFVIDGQSYALAKNEPNATLHGGPVGFGKRFWSATAIDSSRLQLALTSEDGDQGFPGEVTVTATYELVGNALRLVFDACTTRPTPLTLSAHPYFNLDGIDAPDCLGHRVQIFAPHYLPTDARQIPTGEITPVAGTPFDFTEACRIGARIRETHVQLQFGRGYDHYFVLPEGASEKPRLAARVQAAESGRILEILTTQRGLQFYTGNNLDGSVSGRGGLYRQSAGFAFEPQGFPNAPNQPNFPSTFLRPGEAYHEEIVYRFPVEGE